MKEKSRIVIIDSGISRLWRNYKCVIFNYIFDKDTMTLALGSRRFRLDNIFSMAEFLKDSRFTKLKEITLVSRPIVGRTRLKLSSQRKSGRKRRVTGNLGIERPEM